MTSGAGCKTKQQPVNHSMKTKLNLLVAAGVMLAAVARAESKPDPERSVASANSTEAAGVVNQSTDLASAHFD
jgi:hypothetical protein